MTSFNVRTWVMRAVAVGITVPFVAGAMACGSDDGNGLSKADLVSQGDAICGAAAEETGALFGELFPTGAETPEAAKAAPIMRQALGLLETEADDLDALQPADRADDYQELVDEFRGAVQQFEASVLLAEKGDTEGYLQALQKANEVDAENREHLKSFGFKTCAGDA